LTQNQIRLIKRFTHNITVLYDGDEAGIKASLRGIDLLLEEGLNVRVVLLPSGEDPDSFARKHSAYDFTGFIQANETDFISFKTNLLKKEAQKDPLKKASLITDIVRTISVIPENIVRSVYIRECSKLLDVDEKLLYTEIARFRRTRFDQNTKKAESHEFHTDLEAIPQLKYELIPQSYSAEKEIIRLILLYADQRFRFQEETDKEMSVADYLLHEVAQDELEFHHPVYSLIFSEILVLHHHQEKITEQYFINHANGLIAKTIVDLITSAYDLSRIWKRFENYFETEEMRLKEIVPEALLAFKNEKVLKLLKETEEDLRHAQDQKNDERMQSLQVKYIVLNNLKMNLSKGLGDRIIVSPLSNYKK
jgi:DNA primase